MIEKIYAPVSVTLSFNHKTRQVFPKAVVWDGNVYKIKQVGLHHTLREGKTLLHIFSVITETIFLKLVLNTDNLHWTLVEVADNEPN